MKIFWKITRESLKILIVASIISSLGGIGLEDIKAKFVVIIPLLILLPALNDMIGDFGTIISSRFTTMLYLGKIHEERWWKSPILGNLFLLVAAVAFIAALYISLLAGSISLLKGYPLTASILVKTVIIAVLSTAILITLMFWIAVTAGFKIYKRNEDPSNFLIPITTSVADFASMLILSGLVYLLF